MKKFKISAMLLFAAMLAFSACGGGGGGSDDPGKPGDPGVPDDPNYTIEIKPENATLYLKCEYEFYAKKENDSKHLDNITWEVDDTSIAKIDADGKLTPLKAGKFNVTGTAENGKSDSVECTVSSVAVSVVFESSAAVLTKYKGSDKDVAIPVSINGTGINSIEYGAFHFCSFIKTIEIPSCVKSLGWQPFDGCISLERIAIPSGVKKIDDGMFKGCVSLISVDIPSSVTNIGIDSFAGCKSLVSIKIPSNVISINTMAFSGCESLVSIKIPSNVAEIGSSVFRGCKSLNNIIVDSSNITYKDVDGVLYDKAGTKLVCVPAMKISNGTVSLQII